MSYDIYLAGPDGEIVDLPVEMLPRSGTFAADVDFSTGRVRQLPSREASINITYNYAMYYREASGDIPGGVDPCTGETLGIRAIYGMTPSESVPVLCAMVASIVGRYAPDGEYVSTERTRVRYFGEETVEERVFVDEGDMSDYWNATAANAVAPLRDMLTMALAAIGMDCRWTGD